ncbi:MFS transporter [Baekduia soli]|uniref:MFS transporter n=1 Tax=Baekduia soli TaxID=496014 RepID=A0A5B8UB66_9ACTN|nr:MFS transporter [Baekduia soli]QEC49861.1 MFS transporter [Baekduia soli]
MAVAQDPAAQARRRRLDAGFWSVAYAFTVVMAFSTVPSPLYGLYQQRDGFSSFTITVIYGAYAIGVIASLVFAGHVSDWHGRRRVLVPAVAVSVLSALVFLAWREVPGLLIARVVNGLSVGVVTATATAWLAELHAEARPGDGPRRAQLVATTVNLGGLGLGPLISGALAQWVARPLAVPYVVFVALLLLAVVLVAVAPETRRRADPMPAYRPQRVAVPEAARGRFAAAAAGAFVSFGALGLFTGLSATFLGGALHHPSHALAGVAVFVTFWAGVVAQAAMQSWRLRRMLATGIGLMLAGLALTVVAAWLSTPSLALFLAGGALAGGGIGAVFKGAIGTVGSISAPESRAEALAGLFLAGYVGLSVPVVGVGIALQHLSVRTTLLGFALVVGAAMVAAAPRLLAAEPGPGGGGDRVNA